METLNNDSIHEYFREQLDNEIPVAERAKRIDERLQEFDGDYSVKIYLNFIRLTEFYSQTKNR